MKYLLICLFFLCSLYGADDDQLAAQKATEQGFYLLDHAKTKEALEIFQKAIIFDNSYAKAHLGLGLSYFELKEYKEAIRRLKTALIFDETLLEAWDYLGISYEMAGDKEKAFETYIKALNIDPGFSKHAARFSMNITLELLPAGIERREEQIKALKSASTLAGKTIYVENDTPLIDTLLLARFLDVLYYKKKAIVYFDSGIKLEPLFSKGMPHIKVVNPALISDDQKFDYTISLSALPLFFETTLATLPYTNGYIFVEPPQNTHKVGLAWRFDAEDPEAKNPISLDDLLKYAPQGKTTYLLQESPRNTPDNLIPLGFRGQTLDDIRGMVSQMDEVIAVDGTIARLAASMGKKVTLVLPKPCQWVWFIEGTTTPWFKNVELKRLP